MKRKPETNLHLTATIWTKFRAVVIPGSFWIRHPESITTVTTLQDRSPDNNPDFYHAADLTTTTLGMWTELTPRILWHSVVRRCTSISILFKKSKSPQAEMMLPFRPVE